MPWGPYHGPSPSMPMPPTMPTPHHEAIQDDQDDIEIVLGPEHETSSAFASAGTSEYADKGHDRLREQLEHYFSPSNLAVDTFLVSHMNAERFVPISVIADFKRVKAVTRNMDEIVAAIRRSSVLIVDETGTKVKPVPAKPRTTLIIRDLPYETQSKEISDLFEVAKCPAKKIVKEVGNTWFVEFETPEEALAMLSYIRGRTLRGVPLAGRLKSNTAFNGGSSDAVINTPNRPMEQKSSSRTAYGPTLDGDRISSSSDTADYSPPFGRPAYRRFPLEPEEYSLHSLQGSWPSTATEFPFYDISSPMINPAEARQETTQQGRPPMPDTPYPSPHLSSFGRPMERERPYGQFASTQGPPRRHSDSGHSSNYGRKTLLDKGDASGHRFDSSSSNNDSNNYRSFRRNSFSSDQLWSESGPRSQTSFSMDIRDQERQLQMATTPSGNTAADISQDGQSTLPPWIETPAQFAPSNSRNKNKKKNQNQKKKRAANQENKDTSDPIDTVTNKLSDMTACGDKLAQCTQHDHRHKNDNSSTAHEDKPALSPQQDHHHKKGNDKVTYIASNPDNKPYNYKSNKGNNHASTSAPSVGYNNKGKGIKQHKKDKEPDFSILKIDNFPPLSSSHLPTASYAQVVHQDSLTKGSQTSKKTKWQPLAYESITKLQEKPHSSKGRVPHGDEVTEQHEPARMTKAHPDGGNSSSTVAPQAIEEPLLWTKLASIASTKDKDNVGIDPGSIGEASDTDIITTATSTTTATTTTTIRSISTIATPKAKTAPTSPVTNYASILRYPREYHGVEGKEERFSFQ
ncbi:La- protein 4 [Podila clonocystis]|nr:La- protein 4 [Podila clonocystis]